MTTDELREQWLAPAHDSEDDTADSVKIARAYDYIAALEHDLQSLAAFVELLKGMVEQLEDADYEGEYDLADLLKRVQGG